MKLKRMTALMLVLVLMLTVLSVAAAEKDIWQKGDRGDRVTEIQIRLIQLSYLQGTASGFFDEDTEQALIMFQRWNGLLATGMADEKTLEVLFSDSAVSCVMEETEEDWETAEEAYVDMAWSFAAMAPTATSSPNSVSRAAGAWEKGDAYWNTNEYTYIRENGFQSAASSPLSTFAADVDTASYAQLRRMILQGESIPADAVRVEEMLNYFHYSYRQPEGEHPFGVTMELAPCPWNEGTLLLQVGLQAREIQAENRPVQNLVFLIDVSGSMFGKDRLDLVKRAFLQLLEGLNPADTASLVTYASRDEVVLEGVPASEKTRIMEAVSGLEAGGSTNSAAGIQTAYQLAEKYATENSANRILMATDGDFNVGMTSEGDLARLVMEKKKAGVRLTMLGVGYGNYKDNKLEALADYGDGNYYYLDTVYEARKALVTEAGAVMTEVARDVKLQMDFNPQKVSAWRLIGYEDRVMDARDFADDTKDGGEIGSGHRVTALYEIVPVGSSFDAGIPAGRYASGADSRGTEDAGELSGDWCTLAIRYKAPGAEESTLEEYPFRQAVSDSLSDNMKWAAAVTECAMILRNSEWKETASWDGALALARDCGDVSGDVYKEEFVYLLSLLKRAEE